MMRFKEYIINEGGLSGFELVKYGTTRTQLFKQKILDGTTFTTNKGDTFLIPPTPQNLSTIDTIENNYIAGSIYTFTTDTLGVISSGSIKKTKEFGGGKGSGGGATHTSLVESAQCVYCAIASRVLNRQITINDITEENISKASKYVDITVKPISVFNMDEKWIHSSILVANKLFETYNLNTHTFHRGSKFMKSIYDIQKSLMIKDWGTYINGDKWNPGDIWITTTQGMKILNGDYKSLIEYNEKIKELFITRDLISVSLKFCKTIANLDKLNIHPPVKSDSFKEIIPFKRGFFKSTDIYLNSVNGESIQFRSFNGVTGWQSQITGDKASHGKMSVNPLNTMLKKLNEPTLPNVLEIKKFALKPTRSFYNGFYKLYKKYGKHDEHYREIKGVDDFISFVETTKNPQSFRFSKYIGMVFVDIVSKSKHRDSIVQQILLYGMSMSDFSSVFIKIYQ